MSQNHLSQIGRTISESELESKYILKKDANKIFEEFIRKKTNYRKHMEEKEIDLNRTKLNTGRNGYSVSARWSVIKLSNPTKSFKVGERLRLTVYLKDKLRRRINRGGDVLRIWMKETSIGANVNGAVIDNGDGTYTGEVLLPWAGRPSIYVALSHNREDIQSVTNAIDKYGVLNKMYALFQSKDKTVKESVPCGPLPLFALDEERMCNLTRYNYGYKWFSAKPSSVNLFCSDWTAIRGTNNITVPDHVANRIRYTQHQHIGKDIQITVDGEPGEVMKTKTNLCSRRPRENSWLEPTPSGFHYQSNWTITSCRSNLTRTVRNYHKCLAGRHLLLMGDSNTRGFIRLLVPMLKMTFRTRPMPVSSWHEFTYAENQYNNSLSWYPHESPFFANFFVPKYKLQPVSKHLDEIGAKNNSVILIHLWGHFMRIPYDVFRLHVRKIRESVDQLLIRSPDVDIVIKGPHAMTYFDWIAPVDSIWRKHKRIWFEEFKGLHGKVLFLNFWDMTVGTENVDIHPSEPVIWSQIHMFMQLLCQNTYR
ncbi:NXPE family member 2-like [Ylistrum balloti]|uniref:NXPE family member 2-like n=1 Tax=Ylistrum balloti TaxID=509963 RepID=UPI0029059EFB|nr:NXPE family member 2-like [Ylistrum balloti]